MLDQKIINVGEKLSFKEEKKVTQGLRGHVSVYRRNKKTGKVSLWDDGGNIITISGYQWILMKMFGLNLDTSHALPYERLDKDTNLIIPELNQSASMQIGTDPASYTVMPSNISEHHIIQGFMIGNGGAGEDQMTAKNTDYSFIRLRNPIPFQQTQSNLPGEIAGKYLGKLRVGSSAYSKSYYIKKFESTPHIYHSWWKDGQRWDYVDPVTPNDLGPNAQNGAGKTNRIESYVECQLVLGEDDCISYFAHDGNTQTPAINEIALVAYDSTASGDRSIMEQVYTKYIKPVIDIIFDGGRTDDDINHMASLIHDAVIVMAPIVNKYSQENIDALYALLNEIDGTDSGYDFEKYKDALGSDTTINVKALYDQKGIYQYETDTFMMNLASESYDDLSTDEAQRIKLITYYTFKSIPIEENWEILINYRIYAN